MMFTSRIHTFYPVIKFWRLSRFLWYALFHKGGASSSECEGMGGWCRLCMLLHRVMSRMRDRFTDQNKFVYVF